MERHDDADRRFSEFCERAWKQTEHSRSSNRLTPDLNTSWSGEGPSDAFSSSWLQITRQLCLSQETIVRVNCSRSNHPFYLAMTSCNEKFTLPLLRLTNWWIVHKGWLRLYNPLKVWSAHPTVTHNTGACLWRGANKTTETERSGYRVLLLVLQHNFSR